MAERHNLEKTEGEARVVAQEVESDEVASHEEAEKRLEEKEIGLSPEQIERIMAKVDDINTEGTAYTVVADTQKRDVGSLKPRNIDEDLSNKLISVKDILKDGLLGLPGPSGRSEANTTGVERKKLWYQTVRDRKDSGVVHFNILGRSGSYDESDYVPLRRIRDQLNYMISKCGIVLTFDLASFRENKKGPFRNTFRSEVLGGYPGFRQRNRTYSGSEDQSSGLQESEYGYVLSARVAPRSLNGVVFFSSARAITGACIYETDPKKLATLFRG